MSDEARTNSAPAAGPGLLKLGILMLVAGALGGVASGAASAFFGGRKPSAGGNRPADHGPAAAEGEHGAGSADESGHGGDEAEDGSGGHGAAGMTEASLGTHAEPGVFVPGGDVLGLEPFVVNLADTNETRYLKATLKVAFSSAEILPRVKDDPGLLARARDAIIIALSSRTSAELVTPKGKELLREDVRRSLEVGLGLAQHSVRAVYFTEFVTQ